MESSASSIAGTATKTTAPTVAGTGTAIAEAAIPTAITEGELKDHSDAELQSLRSMSASFFHVLLPFANLQADTDSIYLDAIPFIAKIMRESVEEGSSVSSLLAVLLPDNEDLTVAHVVALFDTLETAVSIIRVELFRYTYTLHKNNVYYVMRQRSEFDIKSNINKGKFQIPANHW